MSSLENPYTPPEAELINLQEPVNYPAAGGGKRFLNLILDRLGYLAVTFGFGLGMGLLQQALHTDTTSFLTDGGIFFEFALGFGLTLLYYTLFEGFTGRTLGKWITGTKAVMLDGSRLTFKAAMLRSLCRLIPFEQFSFLGSDATKGWHDTITGTMVVDLRAVSKF